jgi:hypothetical protein
MTAAEITTSLASAIANGRGFSWDAPQHIGNGEVAVYMNSGFGIIARPHPYAGAEYTVVWGDGTEYDLDSTFNNAAAAVRLVEAL